MPPEGSHQLPPGGGARVSRAETLARLTAVGQPHEIIVQSIFGRDQRTFRYAPQNLRDLFEAGRCEATFIVYDGERLSFEQFWRTTEALAQRLVGDLGVRKGDRVAISMRNYPEWMIAFAAATSVGAIAVAFNALWRPDELAFAIGDSDPKVLVLDQERLERLAASGADMAGRHVVASRVAAPLPETVVSWDAATARPEASVPLPAIAPDDDAILFYTSGSVGAPKGVLSTHRAVLSALMSWELDGAVGMETGAVPRPAPGAPQAAGLLAVPLFHVTALHAVFLSAFRSRRRVVSMYKWDPAVAARLIEAEQISSLTAPAAVTGDLVAYAREAGCDLGSLAVIGGGGAARAPEQVRAIDDVFANAAPNTGWGMTETNAIGAGVRGAAYLARPTSSGLASAILDLRIVDEHGDPRPPGVAGELQARGASLMRGYWRRPDANREAFDDGWLRTGDMAVIDAEGFLFIVDRLKDLVIRGGENIGCGAVESVLLEHPDVIEACVYGLPDSRLGEEVATTLHVRAGFDRSDLDRFIAERLARHERPRHVAVQHEPLPRIASGKVSKRDLRQAALERLSDGHQC